MFLKRYNINEQYIKFKLPFFTETYLIRWNPKSRTIIHSHGGKKCDFMVLSGNLFECIYEKNEIYSLKRTRDIISYNKYSINDSIGYHQVFNFDDKKKWSIHRYY